MSINLVKAYFRQFGLEDRIQEFTVSSATVELAAQALLDEMAQLEREGTTFMNKQKQDTRRRRFVAPIVVAIVMSVLMAGLIWLFLWAFAVDPAGAPPLPVLALFVVIPAAVVVGVIIALVQRIREIEQGEEDDAKRY